MSERLVVAIAGASGFVGRKLTQALVESDVDVVAIRRSAGEPSPKVETRVADLFSLLQLERALEGVDVGVYLIHSMLPSARLTQGKFEDLDLVLADNFARAAKHQGLKRIVYLGGLIPPSKAGELSRHLESRREVERVLGSTGIPVVALRAGLVVGPDGSSLKILVNLVRRLPAMIGPRWTRSLCQPIALSDAVTLLSRTILDPDLPAGAYDIGGPDVLTYQAMLQTTAKLLGVHRPILPVPWFSPSLSVLWVAKVTGTPMALVRPLVGSLRHDMVAKDLRLNERFGITGRTFADAMQEALEASLPPKKKARNPTTMTVCSVQRVSVPSQASVDWVARTYTAWVSRFLRPLIDAHTTEAGDLRFDFRPLGIKAWKINLLNLEYSVARSTKSRSLFYIKGGTLSRRPHDLAHAGRFEFRRVPGRNEVMILVLDFRSRLPWWVYKFTQSVVHQFIMTRFKSYMRSTCGDDEGRSPTEHGRLAPRH